MNVLQNPAHIGRRVYKPNYYKEEIRSMGNKVELTEIQRKRYRALIKLAKEKNSTKIRKYFNTEDIKIAYSIVSTNYNLANTQNTPGWVYTIKKARDEILGI